MDPVFRFTGIRHFFDGIFRDPPERKVHFF
jgi:hypothetical protein